MHPLSGIPIKEATLKPESGGISSSPGAKNRKGGDVLIPNHLTTRDSLRISGIKVKAKETSNSSQCFDNFCRALDVDLNHLCHIQAQDSFLHPSAVPLSKIPMKPATRTCNSTTDSTNVAITHASPWYGAKKKIRTSIPVRS